MLIDINCDLGEGMDNDAAILPLVTSANIACGYHAGDEATMYRTVALAQTHGVRIGAHPSFPDRANFGRTNMQLPPQEVQALVQRQIETLAEVAARQNARLTHVKPHGALYNMAAQDTDLAAAICAAVQAIDRNLIVLGLSGSLFIQVAQQMGLQVWHEVFADRTYQPDGTLTPRSQPNALLQRVEDVLEQVTQFGQGRVWTGQAYRPIQADTLCIHGDGAHALEFARAIHLLCYGHAS